MCFGYLCLMSEDWTTQVHRSYNHWQKTWREERKATGLHENIGKGPGCYAWDEAFPP